MRKSAKLRNTLCFLKNVLVNALRREAVVFCHETSIEDGGGSEYKL